MLTTMLHKTNILFIYFINLFTTLSRYFQQISCFPQEFFKNKVSSKVPHVDSSASFNPSSSHNVVCSQVKLNYCWAELYSLIAGYT